MLAEVHGLDMDTAFGRLLGYAREHNHHLSDVARTVVAGAPEYRAALLVDLGSATIAQPQPPGAEHLNAPAGRPRCVWLRWVVVRT